MGVGWVGAGPHRSASGAAIKVAIRTGDGGEGQLARRAVERTGGGGFVRAASAGERALGWGVGVGLVTNVGGQKRRLSVGTVRADI